MIKITLFFGLPIDLILMGILFIYRSIKNLFKVFCFLAISTLFGYCLSDQIRIRFGGQKKQLFCPYWWWWSIKWLKQQVKKKDQKIFFFVVIEDLYCLKLSAIYTQLSSTTRKNISRNEKKNFKIIISRGSYHQHHHQQQTIIIIIIYHGWLVDGWW